VLPDRVTVLATVAETPEEIDVEAAERERAEAEAALKTADAVELERMRARLQMAVTRLQVAKHRGA
jgi:F0F1-type ATP synthase, epsilon subunit (mitochondrial delta subunit)